MRPWTDCSQTPPPNIVVEVRWWRTRQETGLALVRRIRGENVWCSRGGRELIFPPDDWRPVDE